MRIWVIKECNPLGRKLEWDFIGPTFELMCTITVHLAIHVKSKILARSKSLSPSQFRLLFSPKYMWMSWICQLQEDIDMLWLQEMIYHWQWKEGLLGLPKRWHWRHVSGSKYFADMEQCFRLWLIMAQKSKERSRNFSFDITSLKLKFRPITNKPTE